MTLSQCAQVATVLAGVAAIAAFVYAALQVRQNNLIARAQFWLELEKMFSAHDEVHLNLRPGGPWAGGSGAPTSAREWAKLEDYMGLFEHCEIMLEAGLIDIRTFKELFVYRLSNIVANKEIVRAKLLGVEGESWARFKSLLGRFGIHIGAEPKRPAI
jgi:hypothetical protein